ncbi:uncharacterized protein LY89DRAFT_680137 [Mollisia scopiformis]|uniref:Signal peptide peptidase n=1 Tax=Mollisia scopiformis TaxID=149040 RepID=A0A194XUJ8_MOLSC|nr:uncharacterized protein LY89DRAFT_680137 [Mollisia scopiformis]KUJ23382.1 hypothetical protein LY89DRAFT_680137 [Mollisia scopiformis]
MNDSAAMGTLLSYLRLLEDGNSPALQFIGRWAYKIYEERHKVGMYSMYLHLILSSIFPIITGAHASLQQPPSAAKPPKVEAEDDDELDVQPMVEGLTLSDAIMFPVTAGIVLATFYLIIKWMGDAKLLNTILTVYFSFAGVFVVAKFISDGLNLLVSFIFPNAWSNGKKTFYVDSDTSRQLIGKFDEGRINISDEVGQDKTNPLPGQLSTVKFYPVFTRALWAIRASFKKHWIMRCFVHGVVDVKEKLRLQDMIGFVTGLAAILIYNTNGKAWWLSNLMGFGFSYSSLLMMSPTKFTIGSVILSGLFVYDIIMVFYTPMMTTVAKSLEVPIKLVIPGPNKGSILGLGDICIPGMMIGLALRFDLYLHYLRKQTTVLQPPSEAKAEEVVTVIKKAPYLEATGVWGDRFWTRNAAGGKLSPADGARFPKVYFKASLIGYVVGMIVTLIVCQIFQHGQPALLYLVPGVLMSLWGTAWYRGELKLMSEYSEDAKWGWDDQSRGCTEKERKENRKAKAKAKQKVDTQHAHHVALFSVSEPKQKAF